jgi:7-cyano-7-deazaguanine synthase
MKTLLLLSGGLDSTVLLAKMRSYGDEVMALTIQYGQIQHKEIECARFQANKYNVDWNYIDISNVFKSILHPMLNSMISMPEGSYADQLKEAGGKGVVKTYVPNRNMLLLSAAGSMALARGAKHVAFAAHMDDAAGGAYPDCTPEFASRMNEVLHTQGLSLFAPFIDKTKAQIVQKGFDLNVDFAHTWSCYKGGAIPCGVCGTCIDRQRAFEAVGIKDPLMEA